MFKLLLFEGSGAVSGQIHGASLLFKSCEAVGAQSETLDECSLPWFSLQCCDWMTKVNNLPVTAGVFAQCHVQLRNFAVQALESFSRMLIDPQRYAFVAAIRIKSKDTSVPDGSPKAYVCESINTGLKLSRACTAKIHVALREYPRCNWEARCNWEVKDFYQPVTELKAV